MNLSSDLKNANPSWHSLLQNQLESESFSKLSLFVERERSSKEIYPKAPNVFEAFRLTPPEKVRVVILGQDPYHGEGQAHGLAFSVPPEIKLPPSLRNIFKEIGNENPKSGCLNHWARQGVLLLNTVLTVEKKKPLSHRKKGWEEFTDSVIKILNHQKQPIIYLLWGKPAQEKQKLISNPLHTTLTSVHPSPLSAYRGFLGCGHFQKVNEILRSQGERPIDWTRE